jgi:phage terminase large subunit-like protein
VSDTLLTREAALAALQGYLEPTIKAASTKPARPDLVKWAHDYYYIPETGWPIQLSPGQIVFARMFNDDSLGCSTYLYSTIKKSGKTAFAGVAARHTAEFSGNNAEVYFIANDKEQAKDRAYVSAVNSIEKSPGFHRGKRELPNRWRIIEKRATHLPTGSFMQALAGEYESVAGGNPNATFWTELWAFVSERFIRLWDELTPVPTRERSFRYVETYAGFIDESKLLYSLYRRSVKAGDRLTRTQLEKYAEPGTDPWPYPDDPPFYINKAAGTLAYWDEGPAAQTRMPWQVSDRGRAYYREQEQTERPESYQRLHLNYWVSRVSAFIQPAQWKACQDDPNREKPPYVPIPKNWPVVVAVDGSINSDCTAAVGICREPMIDPDKPGKIIASDKEVRVVFARVWEPPKNGVIDLDDVENWLRALCGGLTTIPELDPDEQPLRARYAVYAQNRPNVVQVTYDQFQLHQMMTNLNKDMVVWCRVFGQASPREIADKQLYDLIMRKQIHHQNEFDPEFMANAAAYEIPDSNKNQNRLRIVKKHADAKIDPVVCTSMAAFECLRLLLD